MLDQRMEKRRKRETKIASRKKVKMTNVLEDQDSNTEQNYQEPDVLRKLIDEVLIVDEAGYIYLGEFENGVVEFCDETVVGEPPVVAEGVMYADEFGTIYGSLVEYPAKSGLQIAEKDEEKDKENIEQSENIFCVDEVGGIPLSTNPLSTNTDNKFIESDGEQRHENCGLQIAEKDEEKDKENKEQSENIFYVDEVGGIPLSTNTDNKFIESDDEQRHENCGLQIAEKDEEKDRENKEQSENIIYADEVGGIPLSTNTDNKLIESDDGQRHENCDSDLETEMKIKRLKEEICSLEERIKYIESSAQVDQK